MLQTTRPSWISHYLCVSKGVEAQLTHGATGSPSQQSTALREADWLTESKNLRMLLSTCPITPPRVCLKGFLFDNNDLSLEEASEHIIRRGLQHYCLFHREMEAKSSEISCLVSFRRQEEQNISLDFLGKQLIADKALRKWDFSANHITVLVILTYFLQPLLHFPPGNAITHVLKLTFSTTSGILQVNLFNRLLYIKKGYTVLSWMSTTMLWKFYLHVICL